jgi:steroid delta-isomerase-like uncharacterized protein
MTTQSDASAHVQAQAHLESFFTAYNSHDVDAIVKYFSDRVEWIAPDLEKPVYGRAAAAAWLTEQFTTFPDTQLPMEDRRFYFADDGKSAASSWTCVGTMTGPMKPGFGPTGKPVRFNGGCSYEFRDGLISRHVMVFDQMGASQQIGLMPGGNSITFKAMAGLQRLSVRAKKAIHR